MNIKKIMAKDMVKTSIFFLCVFAFSFTILYLLNFVPSELKDDTVTTEPANMATTTVVNNKQVELPIRITIAKIGVNTIVQNPTTTNIYSLDDLLLHGVVRYPGSGLPGQGNMFFFGHSTGIKIVHNQAYKEFNGLKDLVAGDPILVYSDNHVYTYKVNNVRLTTSDEAYVDFSVKKNMLTLSTCDVFGQKQQRYVVQADYVGSSAL